jgi:hypothetical protein
LFLYKIDSSNGNIGAFFKPTQLTNLSSADTLSILKQTNSLDQNFARVLGPKLPPATPIGDACKVLSSAPVEIILNSKPQDIINTLGSIVLGNMDSKKKSVLAKQVIFY